MRIAIIGAGISGLVAAHHLCGKHDVTILEANNDVGGHTNTIDVEVEGERRSVDTGFIVFNERNYPNFTRLLADLAVTSQPTSMTFSVRCDRTGLEYRGADWNGLFAQRRNLLSWRFHRMLFDLLRFNKQALELCDELDESLSVGEFFQRHSFSSEFIEHYFLPMGSAVWSCPRAAIEQFPIRFIIEFYRNHGLLSVNDRPQWRVIQGGSKQYVAALLKRFAGELHVNCPVERVIRHRDGVNVFTSGSSLPFDHVVFACHSDQAQRILGDGSSTVEREVLSAFPYERNVAVLHTDHNLLPRCRRAWASWNYRLAENDNGQQRREGDKATVTYNVNMLQGIRSQQVFCVTLNGEELIDPSKVLRRIIYEHPVFTTDRTTAQRRHIELINQRSTSFCGAYWGNGFHEDGVNSALAVCEALEEQTSDEKLHLRRARSTSAIYAG